MQTSFNNSWLFKNHFLKGGKKFEKFEKKKNLKFYYYFCDNSKLVKPRFLRDFYFHGTLNVPCTSKQESIRNWRTFCGQTYHSLLSWLQHIEVTA